MVKFATRTEKGLISVGPRPSLSSTFYCLSFNQKVAFSFETGFWAHELVKERSFLPTEGDDIWESGFQRDQFCHQLALSSEPDISQKAKGKIHT